MSDQDDRADQPIAEDRSLIVVEQPAAQPEAAIPVSAKHTTVGRRTALRGRAGLDDVLRMLNIVVKEERTGLLRLRCSAKGRDLYFVQGALMDVRSDPFDPAECLGRVLQRAGMLDQEAVVSSLKQAMSDKLRQGEVMVRQGLLDRKLLHRSLQAQIESKLYPLFEWDRIDFEFQDRDTVPRGLAMADVKIPWLVLQLTWKRYPLRELKQRFEPIKNKYIGRADPQPYKLSEFGLGEAMVKFWNDILNRDQEWQRLQIISNLKESQTYSAVWALLLTGNLVVLDRARLDTDAIRIERVKEQLRSVEKFNAFERLHVHWSADTAMIEKAWEKLKDKLRKNVVESEGIEKIQHERIEFLTKEAYETLRDSRQRKDYRQKVYDEFFLESNSDIFRQKGEGLLFTKDEYAKAVDELASAIEVYDREGEYYSTMGLALFLLHQRTNPAEAQRGKSLVKKGISMSPRSESNYICLGLLHRAEGQKQLAIQALKQALALNPQSRFAKAEIKYIETGSMDKDHDKAVAEFIDRRSDRDKEWDERFDEAGQKKKR